MIRCPGYVHPKSRRVNLFPFEICSLRFSLVDLINRAGQHILVNKKEISIFPLANAAPLFVNEHLLCAADGHCGEELLAG